MRWNFGSASRTQSKVHPSAFDSKEVSSVESIEAVFGLVTKTVVKQDQIGELLVHYKEIFAKPPQERESAFIILYFAFENFIITNPPPVTSVVYTNTSLREEVRSHVNLEGLGPQFRLIFLVENEQAFELFRLAFEQVSRFLRDNLGNAAIPQAMPKDPKGRPFSEVTQDYQKFFDASYTIIEHSLGEAQAVALFTSVYSWVKSLYAYDIVSLFLDGMPRAPFTTERLRLASRTTVEKTVTERTDELRKIQGVLQEKLGQLEQNKLAMINLLEDARQLEEDLKKEKASVEQKVVERTRQLSEEQVKLKASIEAIVRAYVFIDAHENILLVNNKVSEYLGAIVGNWTLSKLQEKLGSGCDITRAYTDALKMQKQTVVQELQIGPHYFDVHVSPVVLPDKSLIGVLILIGDITERKIMERSRDEFFSIASHELRTPLTAIRGNTSMILDNYSKALVDPDLKEMITDVHDSSIRLIDIVNDFLMTSRLEQRRMEFKKHAFDLSDLIHKALKEYQVTGSRANISLTFEEPKEPIPRVFADLDRVREVLINLIGNGIKFTQQGSVTITARSEGGQIVVFVTDTGRGIPIANQSLLFHKFQQAGDSILTRDTTKGTGLGLYISKLIIEGMGGKIWLAGSEVGKGSTFAFTLPVASS